MVTKKDEIIKYYNEIAKDYDESRFLNSYGNYIHRQESQILNKYLNTKDIKNNLDLACGTGRFLEYADYGIDISQEMVKISKEKFPLKNIYLGDVESLPYQKYFFKNILSFHLFMHLDFDQIETIFTEIHRVTLQGGYFIFDIPSKKRRRMSGYKANSWHGGNQITVDELKKMTSNNWELISFHGVAFFPIHRIPKKLRKYFIKIDNYLCNSIFKELSSHLIFILKKK